MQSHRWSLSILIILTLTTAMCSYAQQNATGSEWKPVQDAMGRSGQLQPDGVLKFSMPRKDLKVTADGIEIKAGLALGSWAAFRKADNQSEVMGDLVLTEDEVAAVMQTLMESGVEITALHNHLMHESPRIMYMHIHGQGDALKLGGAIRQAVAQTGTPPEAAASATPPELGFDSKQLDSILGHGGKNNGGIYQVAVPRAERVMEDGMPVPNSMGLATAINFQPIGEGKAATTGDFVLTAGEVNPVIRALRTNGIMVTAIHSHMLNEEPRLFFMHFWGKDDALRLAKGLRAALDQTNSAKSK